MYFCTSYSLAVAFCVLSMLCWGSWGNSQKLAGSSWPYRCFYWDFVLGMLVFSAVFGLTLGSCGDGEAWGFVANLRQGSWANVGSALLGGLVFNAALILLVKAIDMTGLAVAFPVCNGLSIALGTTVNYFVVPKGSPAWIFGGVALITLAVLANAQAGRLKSLQTSQTSQTSQTAKTSSRGIAVAVVSGVFMSFYYSFVARTMDMNFTAAAPAPGMLSPYSAFFLFVVGAFLSTFALNPVPPRAYFGGGRVHLAGFLGAMVWVVGTGINFVAAGPAGAAIAFGLGQGATLVSAIWGIFIWKEFRGAPKAVHVLNAAFAVLFVCGLVSLILAGA